MIQNNTANVEMLPAPDLQIHNMDLERAMDLIEDMVDVQRNDFESVTIFSGHSDKFGSVHIVVQPVGSAVILPWRPSDVMRQALSGTAVVEDKTIAIPLELQAL